MLVAGGPAVAEHRGVAATRGPGPCRGEVLIAVDKSISALPAEQLEEAGYSTRTVTDGHEALQLAVETSPCLVILGARTPPTGGVQVMQRLHARRRIPVILVAADGQPSDRIVGLRLGADDYLVEPFAPAELVARVEAILRGPQELERRRTTVVALGKVRIDPAGRRVTVEGTEVPLTAREYELLWFLARHPGRAFSRLQILDAAWGGSSYISGDTVTVHIRRLRVKIEEDASQPLLLETVRGFGYRLELPD